MLKIAILLLMAVAGIMIYRNTDFSRDAIVARKQARSRVKARFKHKVAEPFVDLVTKRTKEEKIARTEERYTKAGFKINYATNILICFLTAVFLALLTGIGMKNPFMAVVFFGIGWNLPSAIIGIISNKRIEKLNEQVGMFMRMVIKRYQVVNDFYYAFGSTIEDFAGEEPMYSELTTTMNNINRGDSIDDALHDLAKRTDNKYLRRFADYYAITSEIGTEEARREVLGQALQQYEEHMELSRELKKQLSELTMEAYIMLAFVPGVVVYQIKQDPDYVTFMTSTLIGKVGSAVIAAIWLICFWVINAKLGAPIEKEDE